MLQRLDLVRLAPARILDAGETDHALHPALVFQWNADDGTQLVEGFAGQAAVPAAIVVDHERSFAPPDPAPQTLARGHPQPDLTFKESHPHPHLHGAVIGFEKVDVTVRGVGEQGCPLQDGFEQFLLVETVYQAEGGFMKGGEVLVLAAQGGDIPAQAGELALERLQPPQGVFFQGRTRHGHTSEVRFRPPAEILRSFRNRRRSRWSPCRLRRSPATGAGSWNASASRPVGLCRAGHPRMRCWPLSSCRLHEPPGYRVTCPSRR